MARQMLTEEFWSKLKMIMHQQGIYDKPNLRLAMEGMLYRMRTGCPWCDLPEIFGNWNSIYKLFNRWSLKGKLMAVFKALIIKPDLEWEFIDGSVVKAHQHSAGAATCEHQAIGKSTGGNTTKIHMAAESGGLPLHFELTGGEVHEFKIAPLLIEHLPASAFTTADKGFSSETIRECIRNKGTIPVIPRKCNSRIGNQDIDWGLYKYRHLVENLFAKLKQFRAIATRYDKLKRNYASTLAMACAFLWLPM